MHYLCSCAMASISLGLLGLGAGGCMDDDASAPLTVSAASSLTEAFGAYGESLPGEERFSFAGSDELAAQIRQGALPDVFASADVALPEALAAEGLVETPVVFARNELVVVVPQGSAIEELHDLAAPGLDIVIGAAGVPVGAYTRRTLARLPAGRREAILANIRSEESDVKGVVGKVAQGAADAGFVYASDAAAAAGRLRAVPLPPEAEPDVEYAVAVTAGAENPERAQDFVDGLLDGQGAEALAAAGFRPPE